MKKFVPLLIAVAAAVPCFPASAGLRQSLPLVLNLSALQASGAIGSVRDGGTSSDWIDCQLLAGFAAPGDSWVECDAMNANGLLSCFSNSASMISVVQSMQSDSYINFTASTATNCNLLGRCCNSIQIGTGSHYLPVKP